MVRERDETKRNLARAADEHNAQTRQRTQRGRNLARKVVVVEYPVKGKRVKFKGKRRGKNAQFLQRSDQAEMGRNRANKTVEANASIGERRIS